MERKITQLHDNICGVNRQIGQLFNERRQMGGRLHFEEAQRLEVLHLTKDRLLVNALEMRKLGESSIAVELVGRQEDSLHPYSRNHVNIVINNFSFYRTHSKLDNLKRVFTGNIAVLVGQPDSFIEEKYEDYIIRTIVEMNHIGHEAKRTRQDATVEGFTREVELSRLKLELAKKLLRLRANGVTGAELTVDYLRDRHGLKEMDLIEVTYFFGHEKWGVHIILDEYRHDLELQRLIEQGGGFDRRGRRRKHY